MDPGRLQLTLQLVRRRTLQTVFAMQFTSGKTCFQVLLCLVVRRCKHCCMQWLEADILSFNSAGQRDAIVAAVYQLLPQSHAAQTKNSLLRLLIHLAACLEAACVAATLAGHKRESL